MPQILTLYYGSVINPVDLTTYEALPRCLIAVEHTGIIKWIEPDVQDPKAAASARGCSEAIWVVLKEGEFILPGFIDTHTHAPQIPNMGSGQQYELLDWLREVTFPMEARFQDLDFARQAYEKVVKLIIASGTTTCCYYGTLHLGATKILADIVHTAGQRAFVGKCNMDSNSFDGYIEPSAEASVEDTRGLVDFIRSLDHGGYSYTESLVHPILTPRFAISCSSELLMALGKLAADDQSLRIQTHISENPHEIAQTKEIFKGLEVFGGRIPTYAEVYDVHSLLRHNTILAHGVHLEDEELKMIKYRNAGISHCPTSNFNLRSGLAKVGDMLDRGIKVGLGTDVSGGFSPSILTAIQHASMCSKTVACLGPAPLHNGFSQRQLSVATLLHLATLGGAQVCDLEGQVGSFARGKSFDALLVSVRSDTQNPAVWGIDADAELGIGVGKPGGRFKDDGAKLHAMLERFMFGGDDRNIRRVYVQGKWIGGKDFRE